MGLISKGVSEFLPMSPLTRGLYKLHNNLKNKNWVSQEDLLCFAWEPLADDGCMLPLWKRSTINVVKADSNSELEVLSNAR